MSNEPPELQRAGQNIFPGAIIGGERVVFVGKPKAKAFIGDNGMFWRYMVTIAFACEDGFVRRGRFCQSLRDRFTPGKTDDYIPVPMSNPKDWPKRSDTTTVPNETQPPETT